MAASLTHQGLAELISHHWIEDLSLKIGFALGVRPR
jgi:hypothetical protein